ncbi:MAG TPA: hypothetical protein VF669_12920 [Tepidisphaeraceae bacterium]|jgi:hypothetical protein
MMIQTILQGCEVVQAVPVVIIPQMDRSGEAGSKGVTLLAVLVGLLLAAAVLAHWPNWISGPWYWNWWWTRRPAVPIYGGFAVAALPLFVGLVLFERGKVGARSLILLATATAFLMRLAWVWAQSPTHDLSYLVYSVRHPYISSAYVDAAALAPVKGWLAHYHEFSVNLNVHSRNKPPGPILLYLTVIRMMGDSSRTALICGGLMAALQACSVIACAFLLRTLARDATVAALGACYLALCPGFIVPFPMIDPLYTLFAAPLVALWVTAIERDRFTWSVPAGVMLALSLMMMFNFLVIGFFMAAFPLFASGRSFSGGLLRMIRHGAVMVGVTLVGYLLMYLATGFNLIATFAAAVHNQKLMDASPLQIRPWPQTILFDLLDFALGAGWMAVALAAMWLWRVRSDGASARLLRIVVLCVLQLVVVAVTGLLAAETLRVWNFLLPMLILPAALEMAWISPKARLAIYAVLWLVLGAVAQNMTFH